MNALFIGELGLADVPDVFVKRIEKAVANISIRLAELHEDYVRRYPARNGQQVVFHPHGSRGYLSRDFQY